MRKIRFYIALYAAKCARIALVVLGRNATCFPGKVAVKICKDFLHQLKKPDTVVAVTGTNGKTTVSNLAASILKSAGYRVTNNSFGSNIQPGVISALIQDTSWLGKPRKNIAILEVDERSSLLVYPGLQPDYLICNNIMRDSIKRNAHTEFISYIISRALPAKTKLILNGDDLICATLAPQCENRTYFGLDAERPENAVVPYLSDIVYCPQCGGKLEAEYIRYNHIGRMHCTSCDFASPERNFLVTDIDRTNGKLTIVNNDAQTEYKLVNDNIVNIYNLCGVVALLSSIGLSNETIQKGFEELEIVKTRLDTVTAGDLEITMLMAKGQNPIACARCFDYVANCPGENKSVILIIDDLDDNIRNSETTCWLYDCDYSYLNHPSIAEIIFAGPRYKDQYLRTLLAGVPAEKIKITQDATQAADLADTTKYKKIFVLHELYRTQDAAICKQKLITKGESAL